MENRTEIDITEHLEHYVEFLEKCGIPRTSMESKLMLEAAREIRDLRENVRFHISESQNNNKSRLRWMDKYQNGRELFGETLREFREALVNDDLCGWCRKSWITISGEVGECDGFHQDDCFELDIKAYDDAVKEKMEVNNETD